MEYTVRKIGKMAGVSARTLRYYDEIGILKPARINSSGYRIYGSAEVDRLQQILFYRELGVCLEDIKAMITNPAFDANSALREHLAQLLHKQAQLETLIANVRKTLALREGRITMSDQEKFAGFKQKLITENEQKYGKEVREKYGEGAVKQSNQAFKNMSPEDLTRMQELEAEVRKSLAEAMPAGDPASPLAQKAAALHKQWITMAWGQYHKEAHAGVAQMYVDDPRFTAYYDQEQPGTAVFLRDAVLIYTGMKK